MTRLTRKLLFLCILCQVLVFYCPGILTVSQFTTGYPVPVSDFTSHGITHPTFYHGREKRQISDTRHKDGHVSDLTLTLELHGEARIIDLHLKRDLLGEKYFQKHHEGGNEVITRPSIQEADLCHYQGRIRGVKESWAALSTCAGLQGVIYDGRDLHYIHPINETLDSDHFVYKQSDLTRNYSCGYHDDIISSHLRAVRSAPQGPFKADGRSRYLELVLVVDNKEFTTAGGSNLTIMHRRCKDIANIVNALYNPLNIFIALVGVVVWSERDEITVSRKADETLNNFLAYRRMRLAQDHPNDNAQLLTGTSFEGGIGLAFQGPICTYELSGGVNMDHSVLVGLVASTVAHDMGHNLGMEHDTESNCQCPNDRCMMSRYISNVSPTQWSTCSLESLAFAFQKGMDFCLRNKPAALFGGSTCGNTFLEEGEECDCGLQAHCKNPCCNALTCKLHENATCGTGECCDFKTCKVKTAGTGCRTASAECDLPEFCTGQSEFCPADLHKMDGLSCGNNKAYCYHGSCRGHSDQCRLLWGPSGKDSSELQCYKQNSQGNRTGHCGFNRVTQKFTQCQQTDIMCGLLHCSHLNEQLEFGMESVAILKHSFFNSQGRIIRCSTASVDLGLSDPDPGLVPDGAICGEYKMCVQQKCTAVKDVIGAKCPNGCNGNGVCNNLGKCYCNPGYAYPYCDVLEEARKRMGGRGLVRGWKRGWKRGWGTSRRS